MLIIIIHYNLSLQNVMLEQLILFEVAEYILNVLQCSCHTNVFQSFIAKVLFHGQLDNGNSLETGKLCMIYSV